MKKFICKSCNYQTDIRCNYIKHEATKRHHENMKDESKNTPIAHKNTRISHKKRTNYTNSQYKCTYCNLEYVSNFSLDRHFKTCSNKIIADYESTIKTHESTIKIYESQVSDYKSQISDLLKKNEIFLHENVKITNSVLKIAENQSLVPKK